MRSYGPFLKVMVVTSCRFSGGCHGRHNLPFFWMMAVTKRRFLVRVERPNYSKSFAWRPRGRVLPAGANVFGVEQQTSHRLRAGKLLSIDID
jgi:hypothetical protein